MRCSMSFMVNVIDQSMSPKLIQDDIAYVRSGFEVDDKGMGAVLVSDSEKQHSELLIRKVYFKNDQIILKPLNSHFPTLIFEGEERKSVRLLGVVYQVSRPFGTTSHWITLSKIATSNRTAVERDSGNITGEPNSGLEG